MYDELEYEFEIFKGDMARGETFCQYFNEGEYEDEYSHNEIDEWQTKFINKITEYLHENYPGRYLISSGWCVFVVTKEEAQKRNMYLIDLHIVN